MIFVRNSCMTWNHNGDKGMQYPTQLKSFVITICLTFAKYPYLKCQWILSVLRRIFFPLLPRRFGGAVYHSRTHCFILLQFFMGSVLLIFLICSWIVHQCCMCLLSSPLPSFSWGLCCSYFSFVSWIIHQCCMCLLSSPPVLINTGSVVHFALLLFVFTFTILYCEVRCNFLIKNDVRFVFTSSCLYDGWCLTFW